MANAYFYSNTAVQTTLSGNISNAALTFSVAGTTGFPTSYPFVVALDYGGAAEELVSVTNVAGTTLTVTRGFGGTSAQSHSIGAVVRHVVNAQDLTDFRTHEAATGGVHGVAGTLVGTSDTQTLGNKTLTSPVINGATVSGTFSGTFGGTPTFSGAVVLSGTPNVSNGAALAGTFTGAPTFSGNATFSGALVFSGNPSFTGTPTFSNQALLQRTFASGATVRTSVTGDANDRFYVQADGGQNWGPGTGATDTKLYRSAVGTLTTDGALAVGGDLAVSATTWTPFTPTWTVGGSPSFNTNVGWYKKFGKIVFFEVYTVWSSSGSGSTQISFNLPSTPFRDGNGANTTRQLAANGWAVNLNTASNAQIMGQVLAGGAGATAVVAFYDTTAFQSQYIVNTTIVTLQGWYREA